MGIKPSKLELAWINHKNGNILGVDGNRTYQWWVGDDSDFGDSWELMGYNEGYWVVLEWLYIYWLDKGKKQPNTDV